MSDELPPDKVAELDQWMARYGTQLDTMIKMYKALNTQYGSARSLAQISASLKRQTALHCSCPQNAAAAISSQAVLNMLLVAISRLADFDPLAQT